MTIDNTIPSQLINSQVKLALQEDIGQQDLTADLIPPDAIATATIITRENSTLCGQKWVEQVFEQLDPNISIKWSFADGDQMLANDVICTLHGLANSLTTGITL
ncbi:MAG: hypothetical protein PSN44_08930 [Gammaproteobacteria bacterium]|nr:hypothetical protein [Gammaproteobacteria bacterium]